MRQDLTAAGAGDLADVLDLDGADLLAGAAGRAGPDLALAQRLRDEVGLFVPLSGFQGAAVREQGHFQVEQDHFGGQGLAAGEGRAGVLAAAAFHAGEGVEIVLPGEIGGLLQAVSVRGLEVDRLEPSARGPLAEKDVERTGEHVKVLRVRDVGDEAGDGDDVGPPGDPDMGGDGLRAEPRLPDDAREPGADEGQPGCFGVPGDGKGLEIEVRRGGQSDESVDDRRIPRRRGVSLGTEDEPPEGQEGDPGHDGDRSGVDEQGEEQPEAGRPEEMEAVEETLQGVVDAHRVERERAVEDEGVHEARGRALTAEGAPLEKDLDEGPAEPPPKAGEPVLGPSGQDDPQPAEEGREKGGGRERDEQNEEDLLCGRQHAGNPFLGSAPPY